ncbi:serine/threonine-protein kinase [Yasminevirus sp. GU-2018]|uniref:Serine/threonine-protein kinase n=1 Tax=Yasminevirus sp. GU-2018 TaxID=2420051 RepID=A0A5K0U8Y7_9VIRU|nr:serine/threonine-protein kinase [Yasminevirus sp. GU-2018]
MSDRQLMSLLNMSYHNLDVLIKNLDVFRHKYTVIGSLKTNQKRGIYEVLDNFEKKKKVLKFIVRSSVSDEQIRMFKFFMECQHPNFCKIDEMFETGMFLVLVTDRIEGETMCSYFSKPRTHREYYRVLFDLVMAIEFLHSKQIIHGDIKPNNVIIRTDGVPVFIDYDLSRYITGPTHVKKMFGTKFFMSPEMVFQKKITTKTDMWSLGMTLYACTMKTYTPDLLKMAISVYPDPSYVSYFGEPCQVCNIESVIKSIPVAIKKYKEGICSTYGKLFMTVMCAMLVEDDNNRLSSKDLCQVLRRSKWYNDIYENNSKRNNHDNQTNKTSQHVQNLQLGKNTQEENDDDSTLSDDVSDRTPERKLDKISENTDSASSSVSLKVLDSSCVMNDVMSDAFSEGTSSESTSPKSTNFTQHMRKRVYVK